MMASPVVPLRSLIALANCTFMIVSALLHVLDRPAGFLHVPLSPPPQGAYGADLLRGPERIPQQPLGMELPQPLPLLQVALPPRQALGSPCVDEVNLETRLLQDVIPGNPVHPG